MKLSISKDYLKLKTLLVSFTILQFVDTLQSVLAFDHEKNLLLKSLSLSDFVGVKLFFTVFVTWYIWKKRENGEFTCGVLLMMIIIYAFIVASNFFEVRTWV